MAQGPEGLPKLARRDALKGATALALATFGGRQRARPARASTSSTS